MFDHDSNAEGGGLITADFFTQGSMAVAVVSTHPFSDPKTGTRLNVNI